MIQCTRLTFLKPRYMRCISSLVNLVAFRRPSSPSVIYEWIGGSTSANDSAGSELVLINADFVRCRIEVNIVVVVVGDEYER